MVGNSVPSGILLSSSFLNPNFRSGRSMVGGRNREFDETEALDLAMRVFWKQGYSGASLASLTSSMGINKPSMYSAFGNKEALFILATEHYVQTYTAHHLGLLNQDGMPLSERISAYLYASAKMHFDNDSPPGCFFATSMTDAASGLLPEAALTTLTNTQNSLRDYLLQFFEQEHQSERLPDKISPKVAADFLLTLLYGCASMARADGSLSDMKKSIDLALQVFK
ncbi:MAG: TetR family transcriptional regulator [Alteromonadaceae bacterium]|nr:MAG: TetR family transcriptional regulator [Alteromonadaceae bacterium]